MKWFLISIFFLPFSVNAQLRLNKVFTDNMVLQRDKPVHIWGKGIPGKNVEVTFANKKRNTKVKIDSTWIVEFAKQKENAAAKSIIIKSGNENVELKNILIGDVWLCIGQSNMEWPMVKEMYYKEETAKSFQPLLRFFNPTYAGKNTYNVPFTDSIIQNLTAENFYKGQWQNCDSVSFKTISAVGYYFGKEIMTTQGIPIGLINISIGGAPLESFISKKTLRNSRQFFEKVKGEWLTNDALPVWIRERGSQNISGIKDCPKDENGNNHSYKPGFAYQSGIEPIINLPIKGILCYQGESNAQEVERVNEYGALSVLMVNDFRKKWKQQQLPFYYVQLSSIDTVNYKGHLWPQFRDEQRKLLKLIPNSGMAVCSDVGLKNDVHPTNKKDVGKRLARWALNNTYHSKIIPSGPLPLSAKYKNGKIVITFQYSGISLLTEDGKPVRGFSTDGLNDCQANIKSKTIVISIKEKPEFIYYGWRSFTNANLVNSEKLPASTFKIKVQ